MRKFVLWLGIAAMGVAASVVSVAAHATVTYSWISGDAGTGLPHVQEGKIVFADAGAGTVSYDFDNLDGYYSDPASPILSMCFTTCGSPLTSYADYPLQITANFSLGEYLTGEFAFLNFESMFSMQSTADGLWTIFDFVSDNSAFGDALNDCAHTDSPCSGGTGYWVRTAIPEPDMTLGFGMLTAALVGFAAWRRRRQNV